MKKRVLAMVLAAAMGTAMLAGCGSSSDDTAADAASTAASETEEAAETATSEAEAEDGETAETSIEKIVFATNPEFPPFEFITTDGVIGEYDGIDMAIAAEIGERTGVEVEMQSMEFDSLLVALQNGQIDATIAGMTVTDERAKTVDFTTAYYTATQVMIVAEDSDIASAADMEGKVISVVQGYTGETVVQDLGYEYQAFKKGTECIMELLNGKCDVVVIDSATAEKYLEDNSGLKIVEDEEAFGAEEYAMAVAKGNTELLDLLNNAIEEMLSDGTISELSAKYIDGE
ncbi:MAG: transporter substrate-binding domain-containing protein [Lachnospiraceae bacterium]|nr:transporter substrate-binding domain-containing protein [Lachnospiraceae bacterium]